MTRIDRMFLKTGWTGSTGWGEEQPSRPLGKAVWMAFAPWKHRRDREAPPAFDADERIESLAIRAEEIRATGARQIAACEHALGQLETRISDAAAVAAAIETPSETALTACGAR